MTEAEELELLRLRKRRAAAMATGAVKPDGGSMPRPDPSMGAGEAAGRMAAQGATANFGDEINAALQASQDSGTPWFLKSPIAALAEATSDVPESQRRAAAEVDRAKDAQTPAGERFLQRYQLNRDSERAANKAAKESLPAGVGTGIEIAAGIPLGFALPGAKAKGLLQTMGAGALAGGLGGAGSSEADLTQGDVGGFLGDTAWGAGLGAGLGVLASGAGKLVGRAAQGIRRATADAGQLANNIRKAAEREARSALGGEAAAAKKALDNWREIAVNALGEYPAEMVTRAKALLATPAATEAAQRAASNSMDLGAERLVGSMMNAEAAHQAAKAAATPGAIEQYADELLANPIRKQILPRLKNIAERIIPATVGAHVGGLPGAVAGFGAGAVMGKPNTTLANMLRAPATRKMGWELLQALGRLGASPTTTAVGRSLLNTEENAP